MGGQTDTETDASIDSELVALVDQGIAEAERRIEEIETQLAEQRGALRRLRKSRKALVPDEDVSERVSRTATVKTAFQRAGRANVDRARDLLRHNGPTAKAELTRLLLINDGTVHYALLALEERGEARRTGAKVRGSAVYEYVAPSSRRAVTRPGDRS